MSEMVSSSETRAGYQAHTFSMALMEQYKPLYDSIANATLSSCRRYYSQPLIFKYVQSYSSNMCYQMVRIWLLSKPAIHRRT